MNEFLKKAARIADPFLSFFIIPAAVLMWVFRKAGAQQLPLTTKVLRRIGVFPIIRHYYEPNFEIQNGKSSDNRDRDLPGIDFRIEEQLSFLKSLNRSHELEELDLKNPIKVLNDKDFFFGNGQFLEGDAEFLYQMLRNLKPATLVEIGSGHSTKIARYALEKNKAETGHETEHICIEPYGAPWLEDLGVEVIRKHVEEIPLSLFENLRENDLLFIDSTHMIRPDGDVLYEYLEIIPRLRKGVYVHVHDIFSPKDYPAVWLYEEVRFWNEQYLLEAMLTHNSKYKVVASLNHLLHKSYPQLKEVCPYLNEESCPGSFYLQITQ